MKCGLNQLTSPQDTSIQYTSDRSVTCPNCGTACKNEHGLKIHQAKMKCSHNLLRDYTTPKSSYQEQVDRLTSDRNVACPNCGKVCKNEHGLKIHQSKSTCGSASSYYRQNTYTQSPSYSSSGRSIASSHYSQNTYTQSPSYSSSVRSIAATPTGGSAVCHCGKVCKKCTWLSHSSV